MEDYQKFWTNEIELLLNKLNASESLHINICDTLQNNARTGIYENQIINALRLAIAISEGNINTALISSMQSGKSKTIYFLCNYVLPETGFIGKHEHILFVTSMRDTDLYNQNSRNLESEYYDAFENKMKSSKIKVLKMNEFFKSPNPQKVVKDYGVKLIIRDEDQYGCGEESLFQFTFFNELRRRIPSINLLSVSATPYDILDAYFQGDVDVEVIEGVRPPSYYGISEMINDGVIENLPKEFQPLQDNGIEYVIHPKVYEMIQYLNEFEDGLGIIRESNTLRAIELRNLIREAFGEPIETIVIGSDSACDFGINEGLAEVSNLVIRRGKKVVLIVVQALTAGKDLGNLKEKVRFGIETRDKQLANGAQGIAGRCCGYHSNRNFKILANLNLLRHYARFEQDWEIFSDEEWRSELFENSIKGLTTQTRFQIVQQETIFTEIDSVEEISFEEMSKNSGRDKLFFLNNESYNALLDLFTAKYYNNMPKGFKLNAQDVTVRIASSYKLNDNRVYKNWPCGLTDDFGSVFFKKKSYKYGLLISNYPAEDARNLNRFCGIKIFKSGLRKYLLRELGVLNTSMYSLNN